MSKPSFSSWNSCDAIAKFEEYLARVCDEKNEDFIPVEDRVACFDNDGTLWCEQPIPIQVFYCFERICDMAKTHPEMREKTPFKEVIESDLDGMKKFTLSDVAKILEEADQIDDVRDYPYDVRRWFDTARHPRFDRPFRELTFKPMIELVRALEAAQFRVFLVSAGSTEFMRAISWEFYGIPPERVMGTRLKMKVERDGETWKVSRLPELEFVDDKEGKVLSVETFVGQRPCVVVGNSNGDIAMMEYASAGKHASHCMILHHTDEAREYAYNDHVPSGSLTTGLDRAKEMGWTLIDMKTDFKTVF